MKMRRTLPHNLLVSECISQLRFHVRVRERGEWGREGGRERVRGRESVRKRGREGEGECIYYSYLIFISIVLSNYISDTQSFTFLLVYVYSVNVWDI